MKKILLILVSVLCFACEYDCEREYCKISVYYANESSYIVDIDDINWQIVDNPDDNRCSGRGQHEATLKPNEKLKLFDGSLACSTDNADINPMMELFLPASAIITIGERYQVTSDNDRLEGEDLARQLALWHIDNYTAKRVGDQWTLTYTFTDADYEYAVEHGQRITEE